jgi:hypothetical protein
LFAAIIFSLFLPNYAKAAANTGTTTAPVKDAGGPTVSYTTLSWTETLQASTWIGTGLITDPHNLEFRAGTDTTPDDGGWTTWTSVTNGGNISAFSGNRYYQYRATLNSDNINNVPTLNSVTVNVANPGGLGTLGGVASGDIGLRADAGAGATARATSLTWSGTTDSAGQKILFKVRAGDTQAELDTNQCYGPTTLDSGCADWTTAGKFFSQINGQANSATTIPGGIASKRYIEVLVRLESTGANTPVLSSVTLTYDTLEAPTNSNLILSKTDGTSLKSNTGTTITGGVSGAYTNETSLRVTANNLTCGGGASGQPACAVTSTNLRPEVQASTATNFSNPISATATAGNTYADLTGLAADAAYHLRVRAIDDQGRVSGWTSYGGNESTADVTIDQTAPSGTVSINGGAEYASSNTVTLTTTASDTGGSNVSQMRISNDGTFDTENWETYAATKAWTLAAGEGTKTVYVQYRDNAGNLSGESQTSQADFSAGVPNSSGVSINPGGYINLIANSSAATYSLKSDGTLGLVAETSIFNPWYVEEVDSHCTMEVKAGSGPYSLISSDICPSAGAEYQTYNFSLAVPAGGANSVTFTLWGDDEMVYQFTLPEGYVFPSGQNLAFSVKIYNDPASTIARITTGDGYNSTITGTVATLMPNSDFYTSKAFGGASSLPSAMNWHGTESGGSSIQMQIMAGPNTDATGGIGWTTVTNGQEFSSVLGWNTGFRYMKYKVILNSGTNQTISPILDDVSVSVSSLASITLDTAAPTAFSLSSPANNTWQGSASPTLSWTPSASTDVIKQELWINDTLNKTINDRTTSSTTPQSALSEANYSWYLKAYDGAGNITQSSETWNVGYDVTAPGNVTGLVAPIGEATQTSVMVRWQAATDNASGITAYTLERKRFDDDWTGSLQGTYQSFALGNVLFCNDTNLAQGYKYNYRIKAKDGVNLESAAYTTVDGFTVDTTPPDAVTGVTVTPTTGANKGYELKLTWNASSDTGVGLSSYRIWRRAQTDNTDNVESATGADITNPDNQIWTLAGVLPAVGPVVTEWYDNDTNNEATDTVKTTASPQLNDYTPYYYRITALDVSGNSSDLIPRVLGLPVDTNRGTGLTPDVTAPSAPSGSVSAMGQDGTNPEPNNQRLDITWSAASDLRNPTRVPTGSGSGVKEYKVYRDTNPSGSFNTETCLNNGSATSCSDIGLAEDTAYYYKIKAYDNATPANESLFSDDCSGQTKNSQVPSTPTNVTINSVKGDPTNPDVGTKVNLSFTGSKIKVTANRIDGYKVFRSTSNLSTEAAWLNLTPVYQFTNLNIPGYDPNGSQTGDPVTPRTYQDTVPTDAITYYYRIQAFGWNDSNNEVVTSGLSSINLGAQHTGWDIVPDSTAPATPQDVKIQAIWGANPGDIRMVVTWQKVPTPLRNGTNDFKEYRLFKSTDNALFTQIKVNGVNPLYSADKTTAMGSNYYVDSDVLTNGTHYYYYVLAVDDAADAFRYPDPPYTGAPAVNSQNNLSDHSATVDLNPQIVVPSIDTLDNDLKTVVSAVGVSSATISWTTNQPTESVVAYRKSGSSEEFITTGREGLATQHSVSLRALEAGTTYEYRVSGKNAIGNDKKAGAGTDDNNVAPLVTSAFNISGTAVETTTTTATIKWTTPIQSDSSVEYKEDTGFGSTGSQTAGDPGMVTNHEVTIKALKQNTSYTYKIRSVTADKYIAETQFLSFRTKAFDASQFTINPDASNIAEQNITATSAKIVWQTAVPTTTWVDFGDTAGKYSQAAGDDILNTVHVVELKNLTPGTTYFYRVRGIDASDIEYTSKEYQFTAVLKPIISELKMSIVDPYTALATFNTNVDTEASVTYGVGTNFDLKSGTTSTKRNHSLELKNLEDNTAYSYYVEVRDKIGNIQKSPVATFSTPLDKVGAKIENLKIDMLPMGESDEFAQVIISWNSNKPTSTKVEYDEGMISGKYGKSTIEDPTLSSSHTVIIKDLNPSSTYHFRIAGKDKRGNMTSSQDFNFVTPEKNKSVWQLIVRSLEETFSWVKDVGGFFRNIGRKAQ